MATTRAVVQPQIVEPGPIGFALWARRDNPALYMELVKRFPAFAEFERIMRAETLGDFDISSIGDAIGGALSSVGSFLATNAVPLLSLGAGAYVATQQARIATSQLQRAQSGAVPVRTAIAYTAQGVPYSVPVGTPGNIQPMATASASWIPGIPNWALIAGGVGAVGLFFALKR